jgi:CBS domain-containing protein
MGTITATDIAQAVAEGKNPNEVRIRELMTRHPDRHQHGAEHP